MSRAALEKTLGAARVGQLEEAGVLEYIEGVLDDDDNDDDEIQEAIAPMLVDTGVAEDEDAAAGLCKAVVQSLRVGPSASASAAPPATAKKLNGPVSMFALVAQDESKALEDGKKLLGPALVNINSSMNIIVNSLIEEDESAEAALALHPPPSTLHPSPSTLHPSHLHPSPFTLHLHPSPFTLHPSPFTLQTSPFTRHPSPPPPRSEACPEARTIAASQ